MPQLNLEFEYLPTWSVFKLTVGSYTPKFTSIPIDVTDR